MTPRPMELPQRFFKLFEACARAGGRALVVGGAVRDHCRGEPPKDLDVEVHGLDTPALEAVLRTLGRVGEVGKSFGVYKLRLGGDEVDVSVPRRDKQAGTGHKGILTAADPHLGVREAARRRDLTINAIAWDPLARMYEDPYDGLGDIDRRTLRAVDPTTFVEDPLRALRVAQFAARFGYTVAPDLLDLCATMPLRELPAERIWGEIEKLFVRSPRPSDGWQVAEGARMWEQVVPEWSGANPARAACLDRVAKIDIDGRRRRLALLLAAACTGLDAAHTETVLDRLNIHRLDGYRVREQTLALVRQRDAPPTSDPEIFRAAETCEIDLLSALLDAPELELRAATLGVRTAPLPVLLRGKDLLASGLPPGPEMGALLAELREEQLSGRVSTQEEATSWVAARIHARAAGCASGGLKPNT